MKKLLSFIFPVFLLASCDDGDIIITNFEFDDITLQVCQGAKENEFVFFKINTSIDEAISYNFISETFSETTVTSTPILVDLANNNSTVVYRKFNTGITADYYCSNLPPSNITVTEELISTSGIGRISTEIIEEDDNDDIPAEDEDINGNGNLEDDDTDGDGIPNYLDQDDDNDNILTSVELPNEIPDNDAPRDTDKDGIPDYLEADDDGDGIPTRNEDADANGNPRDDRGDTGLLLYLDPASTNMPVTVEPKPENTIRTTYRTTVLITDIIFDNNNGDFQDDDLSFGFRDVTIPVTKPKN